MTLEWFKGNDCEPVTKVLEQEGWTPINEEALVLVAMDDQGLASFHVLRVVPHAEPLWVRPDLRGTTLAVRMATEMAKFLKDSRTHGVMVVADDPTVAKICESLGMRRIASPVYLLL